ncbi:MAG: acyl carrier protein [Bacteroidaceae bacterium]|nr:acyl carrier protein [Bacteroidaceae bacterium]
MEIKEFIENLAAQYEDTDADVFTAETKFRELDEWSSLTVMSIMAMADEEYDVTIKGDEIRSCTTVADLYNLVVSKANV